MGVSFQSSFPYLNSLTVTAFSGAKSVLGEEGFLYLDSCPKDQILGLIRQKNTNLSQRLKQDIKQKASIKLHTDVTQMVKHHENSFLW